VKAVLLTRHGGPEVLRVTDVPIPEPKAGEVRVRVEFIGINFAEILSRRGVYSWAPRLPYILGMEASGTVDAVGEGVAGIAVGDAVIVGTQYGTYAEFICVPAERALPAPQWLSMKECAAFAVNYLTAWIGLMYMARLRPSDTLLVTSAAGGVGTAAVQIGSKFGARVIGASGEGKQQFVRDAGAAAAIDYRDLAKSSERFDAVLEMAGGRVYRDALRRLEPMGRLVVAGASAAFPRRRSPLALLALLRNLPRPSMLDMVKRSYGVMGFHVGWLLDAGIIATHWRALTSFCEEHRIHPFVGAEFEFGNIAGAHRALEERRNVGKVVVAVG
jgi:NADPH2:quinone reductase